MMVKSQLKFSNLCRVPMFLFGLIAQVVIYTTIGFLVPTLAIHLKSYEIETFWIGIFFSLPCVMYIVGSLLIPCYQTCIGRRGIIFMAFVLLIISVFMIGTSPMLNIKDSPKLIFSGLCLLGLASSAITIPVLPEMLDQLVKEYPSLKDSSELNDMTVGYFNGCLGLGEAIGPLISSALVAGIGFRSACDFLALTCFVYVLLFFLFNGRSDIF